jgi:hypothetical protein
MLKAQDLSELLMMLLKQLESTQGLTVGTILCSCRKFASSQVVFFTRCHGVGFARL